MLSCDPERNWFRIVKACLISSTRPALTSVSAPFPMTRRLPLPARRTFASIDRTTGSRSQDDGIEIGPLARSRLQRRGHLRPAQPDFDPIGRDDYLLDNFPDEAFHLDGRRGEPTL